MSNVSGNTPVNWDRFFTPYNYSEVVTTLDHGTRDKMSCMRKTAYPVVYLDKSYLDIIKLGANIDR